MGKKSFMAVISKYLMPNEKRYVVKLWVSEGLTRSQNIFAPNNLATSSTLQAWILQIGI